MILKAISSRMRLRLTIDMRVPAHAPFGSVRNPEVLLSLKIYEYKIKTLTTLKFCLKSRRIN